MKLTVRKIALLVAMVAGSGTVALVYGLIVGSGLYWDTVVHDVLQLPYPVTLVLDAGGRDALPMRVHVVVTAGLIFVPVLNWLSIVCWVVFSLRVMVSDVYFWFNPPKPRKWEHLQSGVHSEAPASTLLESDK